MISYRPFFETAKAKGFSTYTLIHKHGIANGTLYRIRKGKPITTETLNQLCTVLGCRVEDVLLFVPDDSEKV
jgi:DNA-binding Xre family transcriptional regulator